MEDKKTPEVKKKFNLEQGIDTLLALEREITLNEVKKALINYIWNNGPIDTRKEVEEILTKLKEGKNG